MSLSMFMSLNELKMAEMVIDENKKMIIENWNRFFGKNIE